VIVYKITLFTIYRSNAIRRPIEWILQTGHDSKQQQQRSKKCKRCFPKIDIQP